MALELEVTVHGRPNGRYAESWRDKRTILGGLDFDWTLILLNFSSIEVFRWWRFSPVSLDGWCFDRTWLVNKQRHAQPWRAGCVCRRRCRILDFDGSYLPLYAMVPTYSYLCHGSNRCFLVGWMYCNGMCWSWMIELILTAFALSPQLAILNSSPRSGPEKPLPAYALLAMDETTRKKNLMFSHSFQKGKRDHTRETDVSKK